MHMNEKINHTGKCVHIVYIIYIIIDRTWEDLPLEGCVFEGIRRKERKIEKEEEEEEKERGGGGSKWDNMERVIF